MKDKKVFFGTIGVIVVLMIGFIVWKLRGYHEPIPVSNEPQIHNWKTINIDNQTIQYPAEWRAGLQEAGSNCVDACLTTWKSANSRFTISPLWQDNPADAISYVIPSDYKKADCEKFAAVNPDAAVYCPNPVAYYYFYTNSQHPDVLSVFDELVHEAEE
ncbi:MAG TPA: hypothetical protein VGE63_02425 [Candidatus Paceibacterota bacterium]